MEKVLMNVSLVGMTQPSAVTGCHTANELIAYAARVSNPGNQNNAETAPKLLKYLIKNAHWSPFEMVSVTMEIKTTRDISRQIIRHRSFSFQEFSQRYAESTVFKTRECRLQDEKNRQNSIETEDKELAENWSMAQAKVINAASDAYKWALKNGIAKEQARAVLPEGNTETTLYMSGTLRSWVHYCVLRMDNGTQKEHIEIAKQCWDVLSQHFPDVAKAVEEL
jgi:thymidylate synthase (FAD)